MKKWLFAALILFFLLLAAVFVFFPARQTVTESVVLKCNVSAASKFIENQGQWVKWWPAAGGGGDSSFTYNGMKDRFEQGLYHTAEVRIVGNEPGGGQASLPAH